MKHSNIKQLVATVKNITGSLIDNYNILGGGGDLQYFKSAWLLFYLVGVGGVGLTWD